MPAELRPKRRNLARKVNSGSVIPQSGGTRASRPTQTASRPARWAGARCGVGSATGFASTAQTRGNTGSGRRSRQRRWSTTPLAPGTRSSGARLGAASPWLTRAWRSTPKKWPVTKTTAEQRRLAGRSLSTPPPSHLRSSPSVQAIGIAARAGRELDTCRPRSHRQHKRQHTANDKP